MGSRNHDDSNKGRFYQELLFALTGLTYYQCIKNDEAGGKLKELLLLLQKKDHELEQWECYHDLLAILLKNHEEDWELDRGIWQQYVIGKVLVDENPFTIRAQQGNIPPYIIKGVLGDLQKLNLLLRLDLERIGQDMLNGLNTPVATRVDQETANPKNFYPVAFHQAKLQMKTMFLQGSTEQELCSALCAFYRKWGVGNIACCWVFRFDGNTMEGIRKPDPIRLDNLMGLESQIGQLVDNTRQFLEGHCANNILLYGDRGTGKSSSVKGLIHEFGDHGLRLIEVSVQELPRLRTLLKLLVERPQKFIIFIDDLSFEEHETQYKGLKAILEGGVEGQPENVLLYATSNRRHLIKERFSDRETSMGRDDTDEIRIRDTLQEKISLSDRFGITLVFTTPAQKEYLRIVRALAKSRGIQVEEKMLDRLALQWELMHNSRSGRTAKQFIQHLSGKMAMEESDDREDPTS